MAKIKNLPFSNKFTRDERTHLLKLTEKYSEIINDRRASTNIVLEKRQAWDEITSEYNKTQHFRPRLTKQLKRLWENTKARAKIGKDRDEIKYVSLKNEHLSDASIDIEGNNDSICSDSPSNGEFYENIEDERHETANDLLEFEQIFVNEPTKKRTNHNETSLNNQSETNHGESIPSQDNSPSKSGLDRAEIEYDELVAPSKLNCGDELF